MKKLMSILLASVLLFALTACGGNDNGSSFGNGNESSSNGSGGSGSGSVGRSSPPDFSQLPENSEEDFNYKYDENAGGVIIQGYSGSGTYVKIPQVIKSQPVVGIESGAFRDNVEGIYIPDSVIKVSDSAFNRSSETFILYKGQLYENFLSYFYSIKGLEIMRFGDYDWIVLEKQENKVLLISLDVIGKRAYHSEEDITDIAQGYDTTWAESGIRRYLNNEFYSSFNASDKAKIVETQVVNNDNPEYGTPGGVDTIDKIFLLSIDEAERYFADSSSRIAYDKDGTASWWWQRSPGGSGSHASYVDSDGRVGVGNYFRSYDVNDTGGIRPALWLNP